MLKRKLFELKDTDGNALWGSYIKNLSNKTDEEWAKIKDNYKY